MSNFLEQLRAFRKAPVAMLQRFILSYSRDKNGVFAFVEGIPDKEYLQSELKRRAGDRVVHIFVCNGKEGVLAALRDVEGRYPGVKFALFFVDRDFDDYLGIEDSASRRLFRTNYYSVESHLLGAEALSVFLEEMVHLESGDSRIEQAITRYEELERRAALVLRRFVASAICFKRNGVRVNLNNVGLNAVFSLDDDGRLVVDDNIASKLCTMAGTTHVPLALQDLKAQIRQLRFADRKKWFRGKFDLWLFVKYVRFLAKGLRGSSGAAGDRRIVCPEVTERDIFNLFAGRVPFPQDLTAFLDQALGE